MGKNAKAFLEGKSEQPRKEDELKEVDIIIESPVSFEEAEKSAILIKVDDFTLPVISIDKLIKIKRETGRSVDKLDIHENISLHINRNSPIGTWYLAGKGL